MTTRRRSTALTATAVLSTLAAAACGGSGSDGGGGGGAGGGGAGASAAAAYDAGSKGVVNASETTGGVLKLVHPDDWDSPDPGNTYYSFAWNFGRNYGRTLMTYKNQPGAPEVVPDLAAAPGVSSDGGKTWTYTLKDGLKYEDGTPVTSKDIKYAVERSNYAPDVLSNGPTYFNQLLGTDYLGPYKDPSPDKLGLVPIETPDDKTIVFKLQQPFAEFDFLATLPQTVPVPAAKDTGVDYQLKPLSTGPYKVDSYEPGKAMTLSKNPNWDAASDPNRTQLVDSIEVTLAVEANDLDNRLTAGSADLDLAGTGVQAASQAKILSDPNLKKNADNPLSGFVRYVAISTKTPPFDNVHCRRAALLAANHTDLQTAYGGPTSGDIATTLMPPTVLGYQAADRYGLRAMPGGDVEKAKAELAECGQPNGFETVITARNNRPKEVAGAEALQQALGRVGIRASIQTFPSGQYFANYAGSTNFVAQNKVGLMFMGWGADWPSGYGFLQQVADSRAIKASGNTNLSELSDPGIDALFDQSLTVADVEGRNKIWTQVDEKVMEQAAIIPIIYEKALLYRNPQLTNVFYTPAYGMYSYVGLGVER